MRNILKFSIPITLLFVLVMSCNKDEPQTWVYPEYDLSQFPFDKLSEYGFFEGEMKYLNPNASLVPYELNTPLFTDYAFKARFIFFPEGSSAIYEDGLPAYPVGTIILKNFYYPLDFREPLADRRVLETRMLVRFADEWKVFLYLWQDDQQDANHRLAAVVTNVSWIHFDGQTRSTTYLVPSQEDCKGCHQSTDIVQPIGPTTANLNRLYNYPEGSLNQLEKLSQLGHLENFPGAENAPVLTAWDDPSAPLDLRARAYLDVNCAHCHNPDGPANNSGLFLQYTNSDSSSLGFCKPPIAAGAGSGGFSHVIEPGISAESIMIFRMESTEPDEMMPELGRTISHPEGIDLIRQWIDSMEPAGC